MNAQITCPGSFAKVIIGISVLSGVALPAGWAAADTLWIKSGKGNAVALPNVKVTNVADGVLTFTTSSGNQTTRELKQIPVIKLDDEPAFSAAEAAFEAGDWAGAADGYQKAIAASARDWVKDRASQRLIETAAKNGNFADAITGFIELLQKKPAIASQFKPAIPGNQPAAIDAAIAKVKQASQDPKLSTEQKTVLLNYLVDMYAAKGDNQSAAGTLKQLNQVAPADSNTPQARHIQADVKLTDARQAIGQRQYDQAAQALAANSALFTDPQQQADALYLLAQAREGAAKPEDPDQLKDAALAYMRVVANCKSLEGKPHVAESLLRTAAIEEKLKNTKEALALYNQVAAEFKNSPQATQAGQEATRLGAGANSKG